MEIITELGLLKNATAHDVAPNPTPNSFPEVIPDNITEDVPNVMPDVVPKKELGNALKNIPLPIHKSAASQPAKKAWKKLGSKRKHKDHSDSSEPQAKKRKIITRS